jgi:ABC-type glycerol-3-phosphate transport system substrate-binding protein
MFCNNKSQELSVGIAMPPLYEDTQVETKQNISLDLCYAVYRKCKNPEQAMEILQMLTSAEMLQSSFSDLLFIPVKSSPEDQLQFFKEFAPNSDDVNNKIIYPPNSLDWKRTDVYTQVLVDPAMMEALLVEESTILNKSPNAFRSRNVK